MYQICDLLVQTYQRWEHEKTTTFHYIFLANLTKEFNLRNYELGIHKQSEN